MIPAGVTARHYLMGHTALWLLAIVVLRPGGSGRSARSLMAPLRAPATRRPRRGPARCGGTGRGSCVSRESLRNDAAELCAIALVALSIQVTPLALVIAFPLGTLLRRSSRHAALVNEARADAKTGLLNVAAWERQAAAEVARAVRTSTPLAVALLDLDRFKQINDTYGHLLGDEVLRQIAATMTDNLRDYDLAGRFGGEEFVMLLPQTRAVDALRIAERVRAQIAQLPVYAGEAERVPVTASIGVAALDAGSRRELPELLAAADAALYRAKASGRDQVQMISTSRGLSAVRPPSGPDPDAAPATPTRSARSATPAGQTDLFAPRLQLGPHGPLAAGSRVPARSDRSAGRGRGGHGEAAGGEVSRQGQHGDQLSAGRVTLRRRPGRQHLRRRVPLAGPAAHRQRRPAAVALQRAVLDQRGVAVLHPHGGGAVHVALGDLDDDGHAGAGTGGAAGLPGRGRLRTAAALAAAPAPGAGELEAPEAAEQPAARAAPRQSRTAGTTRPETATGSSAHHHVGTSPVASVPRGVQMMYQDPTPNARCPIDRVTRGTPLRGSCEARTRTGG